MSSPIENVPTPANGYVTWTDDASFQDAMTTAGDAFAKVRPITRATGGGLRRFENIDTNISIRDGFDRIDYETFREGERSYTLSKKEIVRACMNAYRRIGIIRNVIDLMSDFTSRGIRIVHPDKTTERMYQYWFKKVSGKERSERFLNMLYRCGIVVAKRNTARLNSKILKRMRRANAADLKAEDNPTIPAAEIPWRYFFINPLTVDFVGDEVSLFADKVVVGIKIPEKLITFINKKNRNPQEKMLFDAIPADIVKAVEEGKLTGINKTLPLDPAKTIVAHYKKDDWDLWADPMIYAVLDDLIQYDKAKLADLAALDGAISRIRLWKVGSLEHKILPTEDIIEKLQNVLLSCPGNGTVIDLIWNPAIELVETKVDVAAFLGKEKYEAVLDAIYAGIGIPQSIRGTSGANMTDNFMQIKTFVEKLQYGRDRLNEFWEEELNLFRKAMAGVPGFQSKRPARVIYDYSNLTDEATQQKLILDLLDRDVISIKTAREEFGYDDEIEDARVKDEFATRPEFPKVSPYHDAQPDFSYKKIFAQTGVVTPSQIGVKLEEKASGEKPAIEYKAQKTNTQQKKKKGVSGQGRPSNTPDSRPRKKRIPLVASENIAIFNWTTQSLSKINQCLLDCFLNKFNKSNARQLTDAESQEFEDFKFAVLSSIEPFSEVTPDVIRFVIAHPFNRYDKVMGVYSQYINDYMEYSKTPTLDERRQLQCLAYIGSLS